MRLVATIGPRPRWPDRRRATYGRTMTEVHDEAARAGEGWVDLPDGRRFWGRAGAAGLLAVAPAGAVLLQHRAEWSHFGGTWGLPGGARHVGETALDGALREAREETGIDTARLAPRFTVVLDLGLWSYTTIAADSPAELPVRVADAESSELQWVAADRVTDLPLHPGFGDAWPGLQALLVARPALVVDVANVMGSRPDGWWRDRQSAAARLLAELAGVARAGLPTAEDQADGLPAGAMPVRRWWPEVVAVLEGEARGATQPDGVRVVAAPGSGDDAVVAEVAAIVGARRTAWAVTADRELTERVHLAGGSVRRPGWLLGLAAEAD